MGNAQTKLFHKLSHILPGVQCWESSSSPWCDGQSMPGKIKDRDQFIHSLITVLTHNGAVHLADHHFHLFYSRRPETDRVLARIVAEKEGVIKVKLEPIDDGEDHAEAFLALRRYVELRLNEILREVPDSVVGDDAKHSDAVMVAAIDEACRRGQPQQPQPQQQQQQSSGGGLQALIDVQSAFVRSAVPSDAPPAYGNGIGSGNSEAGRGESGKSTFG